MLFTEFNILSIFSVVYFVELGHDFLCVGADGLLLLP